MDSAECRDNLSLFTDASPDGDVILVVGSQNVRLEIHSQCLRCALKVFNVMLGPQWSGLIYKDKVFRGEIRNLVQIVVTQIHIPTIRNTTNLLLGPAETLFTFLERAEVKATRVKQGEGLTRSTKAWVRKRRRDSTPPEQLKSDREGRFAEEDQRAAKKAMTDDISYKASSSDADVE